MYVNQIPGTIFFMINVYLLGNKYVQRESEVEFWRFLLKKFYLPANIKPSTIIKMYIKFKTYTPSNSGFHCCL
jgi:hypothetical protein